MMTIRRTSGQALVEFTLFFTLLLLLIAGVVDVGFVLFKYTALSDAAQEGAAYAAINPADTPGIEDRVKDALSSLVPEDEVTVDVTFPDGHACPGARVKVAVSTDHMVLFPFARTFVPDGTVHLSADALQTVLQSSALCPTGTP
ncbi:MAG: hypothetical protein GXO54_02290 [Chloroflexi bacterium]|nr:hypothetical protein [Chloroflexota bacterium]